MTEASSGEWGGLESKAKEAQAKALREQARAGGLILPTALACGPSGCWLSVVVSHGAVATRFSPDGAD